MEESTKIIYQTNFTVMGNNRITDGLKQYYSLHVPKKKHMCSGS
jgi:hypothetical protein